MWSSKVQPNATKSFTFIVNFSSKGKLHLLKFFSLGGVTMKGKKAENIARWKKNTIYKCLSSMILLSSQSQWLEGKNSWIILLKLQLIRHQSLEQIIIYQATFWINANDKIFLTSSSSSCLLNPFFMFSPQWSLSIHMKWNQTGYWIYIISQNKLTKKFSMPWNVKQILKYQFLGNSIVQSIFSLCLM